MPYLIALYLKAYFVTKYAFRIIIIIFIPKNNSYSSSFRYIIYMHFVVAKVINLRRNIFYARCFSNILINANIMSGIRCCCSTTILIILYEYTTSVLHVQYRWNRACMMICLLSLRILHLFFSFLFHIVVLKFK